MRAVKIIFALSLGATGTIGCSSSAHLYDRTIIATSIPVAESSPVDSDSTIPNLVTTPEAPTVSIEPIANDQREPLVEAPDPKPTPASMLLGERMANSDENPEPPKTTPATAQSGRNLGADNRLLESLERDFQNAFGQPKEQRRLRFSKQVINHPRVRHFIRYYSETGKTRFQEILARSGKYMPMIAKVLHQEGLPEELGYLALLESEFVTTTRSRAGAVGLWQFVTATARQYGLRIDEWVDERRDPVKSTRAAAAYLKDLHDYYGRWYLVTAAYNGGPTIVDRALQKSGAQDFWSIKGKAPLSEETRDYVPKFVAIALIAMNPQKYGLDEIEYHPALDYEEVELNAPTTFPALARAADTDVSAIRNLNPALLRDATPPETSGFRVNLPVGKAAMFLARANERSREKDTELVQIVTHEVKKGETLFSIARRYGLQVRALMDFNGLATSQLQIGQKLMIFLQGLRGVLR